MILKILLPFFLFISFPLWSFANSCENGFPSGEVFITFAKKQLKESGRSFEKLLGPKWVANIAENTKHWTHIEASQFLNFLINRIGAKAALQNLMSFSDFPKMSINQLMKKIAAYDKINKEIITSILKNRIPLSPFLQGNNINKVKRIYLLIESYIGEQGAVYLLSHINTYEIFFESNPNTMKKVIIFVDEYTKKYGFVTDTLENRVNYFRQFVSLPRKQQKPSKIQISNFSELKAFSGLIFKKLRELDTKIKEKSEEGIPTDKLNLQLIHLQLIQTRQAGSLFSAFSKANFHDLKETVAVLEQYIKPEEIAKMIMDKNITFIYSANPQNLKSIIDLLKKAHSVPLQKNIYEVKERMSKKIEEERQKGNIESYLAEAMTKNIEQINEPPLKPEEFIRDIGSTPYISD